MKRPPQAPPTAPADPVEVSVPPAPAEQDDGEAEVERELVAAGEEAGPGSDVERDEGEEERELVRRACPGAQAARRRRSTGMTRVVFVS